MEDRELVRDCLDGRVESYKEIMKRYGGQAMALSMSMLMNPQDAEDACQDAFLRAFKNLHSFDSERSFKNWFFTIVSNTCLDMLRSRKRRRDLVTKFQTEDGTGFVVRPASDPAPAALNLPALNRLAPKERLCVHLWAQEDCTPGEIASVLGCTRSTANVYLHRARLKLRSALREGNHA